MVRAFHLQAGAVTTLGLNPYDRALYLSVVNRRPFLIAANFKRPYMGIGQTLVQRALSTGPKLPHLTPAATAPVLVGVRAGRE